MLHVSTSPLRAPMRQLASLSTGLKRWQMGLSKEIVDQSYGRFLVDFNGLELSE